MFQQLLHSYFQKRGKTDKQEQKIHHSCSKVNELLKWTIFMQLPHLYSQKCVGFCCSYFEHIKPCQFALVQLLCWLNPVLNFPLFCLKLTFRFSALAKYECSKNCVQELIKNEYLCVRDCLVHFSLGRLSRFVNLKIFILHWHCLILSFPTHWKILHWTQIIKTHYSDSLHKQQKKDFCHLQHHTEKLCYLHLVVNSSFTVMAFVASIFDPPTPNQT